MSKAKKNNIDVQGAAIAVVCNDTGDFISLTDMAKKFGGDGLIYNWMRNRNTVEFIGIWEKIHNPGFKGVEFETFRNQAGLNRSSLTPRKWIEATGAIGFQSKAGRYGGGTYAHKDIAFEFGSWLSPEFKLYLIKEFQRLKDEENDRLKLDWNLQRTLSKINYRIHTDAIKDTLIPPSVTKSQASAVYASEADLLNVALFGQTAKQWRDANPAASFLITDHCSLGTSLHFSFSAFQLFSFSAFQLFSFSAFQFSAFTSCPPQRHRNHPNADPACQQQHEASQMNHT